MADAVARIQLPRARRLVRCEDCKNYRSEGAEHACPATQQLTGELAGINLARLTNRQWSGIDCALCGLWLCTPPNDTRPLGELLDPYGHRFTLWAHAPNCGAPE